MKETGKVRVLIAEDDFLVSEEISRILKMIGYILIGEATDGDEAVEMTCSMRPDIVLMDIKMPKLDGLKATKQIQKKCPTPVVVLTAHESKDLLDKASKVGVATYITKPPNRAEIERSITIALARHQDLMELRQLNTTLKKEITKRKRAEKKLTGLLKEKEVLLKEIHHRVKNNFNVIGSLINLQMGQIHDQHSLDLMSDCRNRVHTMAMIHQQLYQAKDLASINLKAYISSLATTLFRSYNADPDKILLDLTIENVTMGVDRAIPCGLILNELISNALKYAFPPSYDGKGQITISLRLIKKASIELIVNDNGIGLPSELDIEQTKSMGLRLVSILARDQLQGKLNLIRDKGSKFQIIFGI